MKTNILIDGKRVSATINVTDKPSLHIAFIIVVHELSNKVSWPSWEDLQTSSIIVLTTSILLSLIIWLMDYAFGIWSVPDGEFGWKGLLGFIYDWIS